MLSSPHLHIRIYRWSLSSLSLVNQAVRPTRSTRTIISSPPSITPTLFSLENVKNAGKDNDKGEPNRPNSLAHQSIHLRNPGLNKPQMFLFVLKEIDFIELHERSLGINLKQEVKMLKFHLCMEN